MSELAGLCANCAADAVLRAQLLEAEREPVPSAVSSYRDRLTEDIARFRAAPAKSDELTRTSNAVVVSIDVLIRASAREGLVEQDRQRREDEDAALARVVTEVMP